jgi:hypothetical protein
LTGRGDRLHLLVSSATLRRSRQADFGNHCAGA